MKMISSAKVHKFEQSLKRLLPFKTQIKAIMGHLLNAGGEYTSPLLEERAEVNKIGVVVYGSDDGLCGAYNINIVKQLLITLDQLRDKHGKNTQFKVFPIGKKMVRAVKKLKGADTEVEEIEGIDSKMEGKTVNDFTLGLQKRFTDGELDQVVVVYMNFISMSRQRVKAETLFPIAPSTLNDNADTANANKLYIFEPDANRIFNEVLPMFVLSTMQEITIENRASEQAARIMAMQSANDNAKKLLDELQLEFNKLRQQSITTELLDILGGQVEQ